MLLVVGIVQISNAIFWTSSSFSSCSPPPPSWCLQDLLAGQFGHSWNKGMKLSVLICQNIMILPSLFHHNGWEFVILHATIIKVLVPIFPLVISAHKKINTDFLTNPFSPKYAANLFADIDLGIAVIDEVVKLWVILLLTFTFYPVLPTPTSFTSLENNY